MTVVSTRQTPSNKINKKNRVGTKNSDIYKKLGFSDKKLGYTHPHPNWILFSLEFLCNPFKKNTTFGCRWTKTQDQGDHAAVGGAHEWRTAPGGEEAQRERKREQRETKNERRKKERKNKETERTKRKKEREKKERVNKEKERKNKEKEKKRNGKKRKEKEKKEKKTLGLGLN